MNLPRLVCTRICRVISIPISTNHFLQIPCQYFAVHFTFFVYRIGINKHHHHMIVSKQLNARVLGVELFSPVAAFTGSTAVHSPTGKQLQPDS
jgi:hypothetical protein